MSLNHIWSQTERLITENSPAILTSIGVVGVVGTAVLTHKAAVEAERECQSYADANSLYRDQIHLKGYWRLTWQHYVPPVAMGTITVGAIIFANRIGSRRAAALASAYTISDKAFREYKEKVVEKIGDRQETAIRDEIAQDAVTNNPPPGSTIMIGNGEVLFMEAYTGRYFMSTMETVKKAQNDTNHQRLNDNYASLRDLYNRLDLPPTAICDDVGWNLDKELEIEFSTSLTPDGRPCIVINYVVSPIRGYHRLA